MIWFHRGEGLLINFQTHCFLECYALWREPKKNSVLFTKFSCFCKCHLLHLFRKITFLIFQVQSLFSLSVTLFFPTQWKNPRQFYGIFPLFSFIEFFILPCGKQHKDYWSIDNSFNFTRHISFLLLRFQRVFEGRGNLLLFTIRMALFELKIPLHEISLLRGNE